MTIKTFRIHRLDGQSSDWSKLHIVTSHINALNQIGTTGTHNGEKITISQYFDKYLSAKKLLQYKIETIQTNPDQKTDTLLVIQVTP